MPLRRPLRIHRRFAGLDREGVRPCRHGEIAASLSADGAPGGRFEGLPRRVVLGREVPVAVGIRARTVGLAGLDRGAAGEGLLIPRCGAVHTFGMRFALDVYFLDADGALLSARGAVPPRRFVAQRGAAAVLEVPT